MLENSSNLMKSSGGYIELQLQQGKEYYPELIKLNTARNAFEYILKVKDYTLVYIPYFTCEVLMEPIKKLGIEFRFYHIDNKMDPILDFVIEPTGCLLYTNYFGLKQDTILALSKKIPNLIVDNSQAFFSEPLVVDTFYSCRKFFGVPDGAYLNTTSPIRLDLEKDISIDRFSHLIKSIDLNIEHGYQDYIENNNALCNNPILKMSSLTQNILSGIDYEECKTRRNANFLYLHSFLNKKNDYTFDSSSVNGPMVYPFLFSASGIKKKLHEKRIYVATYWPNVFEWTTKDMFENYLAEHLIALPIDHRYTYTDMENIIKELKDLI